MYIPVARHIIAHTTAVVVNIPPLNYFTRWKRKRALTHEAGGVALVDAGLAVNLDEALHQAGYPVPDRVLKVTGRADMLPLVALDQEERERTSPNARLLPPETFRASIFFLAKFQAIGCNFRNFSKFSQISLQFNNLGIIFRKCI